MLNGEIKWCLRYEYVQRLQRNKKIIVASSKLLQSCLLTGVRRNVCLPGATASSSTRLPSGTGSHRFSGNSRSGQRSGGKTDLIVVNYILVGDKIKIDANTCETTPPYLTMVLTWAKKECRGQKQESREVFPPCLARQFHGSQSARRYFGRWIRLVGFLLGEDVWRREFRGLALLGWPASEGRGWLASEERGVVRRNFDDLSHPCQLALDPWRSRCCRESASCCRPPPLGTGAPAAEPSPTSPLFPVSNIFSTATHLV